PTASPVGVVDRVDGPFAVLAFATEAQLQQNAVGEVSVADAQVFGEFPNHVDTGVALDTVLVVAVGDREDAVPDGVQLLLAPAQLLRGRQYVLVYVGDR